MFDGGQGAATLIMVSAAVTYDVISATNSSPQTTEINARARGDTLMKWVNLGLAQAALFGVIGAGAAAATGEPWWAVVLGTLLAMVLLWAQYRHALRSGLQNGGPPTETY